MVEILTDVVLIVTGFQLIVLAAVLVARAGERPLCRNLMVAFLLAKAFLVVRWFSFRFHLLVTTAVPLLYLVSGAAFFLLAPLLYLHVRSLCYRDFRLRWPAVVHLAPASTMAVVSATAAAIAFAGAHTGVEAIDRLIVDHYWKIFWSANFALNLGYILAMFRVVLRYRLRLQESCSSVASIDLSWLVALLGLISLHWVFVTSRALLGLLQVEAMHLTAVLDLFSIAIFLVFTTVLVVRGLAMVKLFPGIDEGEHANGSSLSEAQLAQLNGRLQAFMQSARPHLNPSLTLEELAQGLGMPGWQLSRVINLSAGQNFFNFINSYRIAEAKRSLQDPSHNHKTMLQILGEAGFNSKSTFNEAFRRHVGVTPTEFRRRKQAVRPPADLAGTVHGVRA